MSGVGYPKITGLLFSINSHGFVFYPRTDTDTNGVYSEGTSVANYRSDADLKILDESLFALLSYKKAGEVIREKPRAPQRSIHGNQFFFDENNVYSWWHSGCGDGPLLSDVFYTQKNNDIISLAPIENIAYYYPFAFNRNFVFNTYNGLSTIQPSIYRNGKVFHTFNESRCLICGFFKSRYTFNDGTQEDRYLIAKCYTKNPEIKVTLTAYRQNAQSEMVAISNVFTICPPDGEVWNYVNTLAAHGFWPVRFNTSGTEAAMLYCTSLEGDYNVNTTRDVINTAIITITQDDNGVYFSKSVVVGERYPISGIVREYEYDDGYEWLRDSFYGENGWSLNRGRPTTFAEYLYTRKNERESSWKIALNYLNDTLNYSIFAYNGTTELTTHKEYHNDGSLESAPINKFFKTDYNLSFDFGDNSLITDHLTQESYYYEYDGGDTIYYTDNYYSNEYVDNELFPSRIHYIDANRKTVLYSDIYISESRQHSVYIPDQLDTITTELQYDVLIKYYVDNVLDTHEQETNKFSSNTTTEETSNVGYIGYWGLTSSYATVSETQPPPYAYDNIYEAITGYENAIYVMAIFSGYRKQDIGVDRDKHFSKTYNISHSFALDQRSSYYGLVENEYAWGYSLSVIIHLKDIESPTVYDYRFNKNNSTIGLLNPYVYSLNADRTLDTPITDETLQLLPIGLY